MVDIDGFIFDGLTDGIDISDIGGEGAFLPDGMDTELAESLRGEEVGMKTRLSQVELKAVMKKGITNTLKELVQEKLEDKANVEERFKAILKDKHISRKCVQFRHMVQELEGKGNSAIAEKLQTTFEEHVAEYAAKQRPAVILEDICKIAAEGDTELFDELKASLKKAPVLSEATALSAFKSFHNVKTAISHAFSFTRDIDGTRNIGANALAYGGVGAAGLGVYRYFNHRVQKNKSELKPDEFKAAAKKDMAIGIGGMIALAAGLSQAARHAPGIRL